MRVVCRTVLLALVLGFLAVVCTLPADAEAAGEPRVAGHHWRLETPRGPVHVWLPPGYNHDTAGIVVYVHGYYTTVDTAWTEHALAEQFLASGRNAVFVVPSAPPGPHKSRTWRRLNNLLHTVHQETGLPRPPGPVVLMGHSGAYRTLLSWLDQRYVRTVVLLDALYGVHRDFARWLRTRNRRLINVAVETRPWSDKLVHRVGELPTLTLDAVPATAQELPSTAASARLLYLRAQHDHMALVTERSVIPLVLQLTGLSAIMAAAQ